MPKGNRPSERFTRIFANAPVGVHRQIIEEALFPLLDSASFKDVKKSIAKARKISKRARNAPQLDLAAKKIEVNSLLDELTKDLNARSLSSDSYSILLQEVVESVADWLNDIWTLTYEYGLEFPRAHSCLLYSIGVLDHVQSLNGRGCHCATSSIYVPVTITDKAGVIVKEFTEVGLANVESAILWVWREVFLSLLASESYKSFASMLPEVLAEIDDVLGWRGLERLVTGGETFYKCSEGSLQICDEDVLYANHWESKLTRKAPVLLQHVRKRMTAIFKASPSYELYHILTSMTQEHDILDRILSSIATTSAASLATALSIYATYQQTDTIAQLLASHRFLLRPRDYYQAQEATRLLLLSEKHNAFAVQVVEAELSDTLKCLQHSVSKSFSLIDAPQRRSELRAISRLSQDSPTRAETIQQWVDAASSPGVAMHNTMAFAAVMVGLPITADDIDETAIFDFDQLDPDFEGRDEFRSEIKGRFLGWTSALENDARGLHITRNVCKQAFSLMPWLRVAGVTDEIITRLVNKPSKRYVCDALESVQDFVDEYRRRRKAATDNMVDDSETQPLLDEASENDSPSLTDVASELYELKDTSLTDTFTDEDFPDEALYIGVDPGPTPFFPPPDEIEDVD